MERRIWTKYKTKPNVIALNCYYPSTHSSDSPSTVIPSSSGLMEEPGKTPRSPTGTWQAVAVGCLITLDSSRNSFLHTSPWQPWLLSSPPTLTSGEHLLPCWWQPAAGGFHWETPWQWHRWRVVSLGGKSQVSSANKQLEETQPFVKSQDESTDTPSAQTMSGREVTSCVFLSYFYFKNLTAQLNNFLGTKEQSRTAFQDWDWNAAPWISGWESLPCTVRPQIHFTGYPPTYSKAGSWILLPVQPALSIHFHPFQSVSTLLYSCI